MQKKTFSFCISLNYSYLCNMNTSEQRLTLYQLNGLVREVIECEMPHQYWVEAELSECRESRGHCYMELIERNDENATPIARASAKCWASRWAMIRPHFERITGQHLTAGMKVLLCVTPQFHEAYGFSWIVSDIDPTYTLGDQVRRRQEIIRQLKEEGVFDLQKSLRLPLFCQHIAVISSETAAGYGDFCNQLADSPFSFRTQLFPTIMQGEGVEQSIIATLENIYRNYESDKNDGAFDCVVIIRGGGATSDLSGFDTLALAENVANFPLPIITGIGHERDECILDMVSHIRVKTPTAAAAFLIDRLQQILDTIENVQSRLSSLFSVFRTRQEARIDTLSQQIPLLLERRITAEHHCIQLLEEKAKALDPTLLLRRGYSITLKDGCIVRDPQQLSSGDKIETRLEKGAIHSIVT